VIVEFIGCIASGKTRLADEIVQRLRREGVETVLATDVLCRMFGLGAVRNTTLRNALLDVVLAPWTILCTAGNLGFHVFAVKTLFRKPDSVLGALNRLRSVLRKTAVHALMKRRESNERIVIVDEGTVHAAHNIFVYSQQDLEAEVIEAFSEQVALPDAVICVRAGEEVIRERMAHRTALRLVFESKEQADRYISRALAVFDRLCATERVGARSLIVDRSNDSSEEANRVADFILERYHRLSH